MTADTPMPMPDSPEAMQAEIDRLTQMRALASKLAAKRDECVRTKREVEQRWIGSLRQYYGLSRERDAKAGTTQTDTTPKPHMTRSRADRWEARLCDMLFPSSDPTWDLSPPKQNDYGQAPVQPQPPMAMPGMPQPPPAPTPEDMRAQACEGAERMKCEIQGQLANCKFPRAGRRMIRDAIRMGTGLLMGPMRTVSCKRKFRSAPGPDGMPAMALEIEESVVPEIREADPWCFFPDMTPTADKAEYAFYAHLMGSLEVRNLAPDFDQKQIAMLLRTKPELGELAANIGNRNQYLNQTEPVKDRYAVWRYTGTLDKDELEVLGLCECEAPEGVDPDTVMPPMAMVDLWFCQDFILRAKLSPIQNDFRIPYYVFSPFPADDTMFGLSVPELCEDSQRVAESAWLIALHNASVSSGPIFISRQGKLKPKDGQYVIRGPKWFEITDDSIPLNDAFAIQSIPNHVDQALTIFDRAMSIMDEELNTAQWASPEPGQEAPTASGLAMLMNIRSILQVRVATAADDEIFGPIIERMYWWNMLYNPDDSIKGDYDVVPLVQSVRLVKDVQVQHLQAFTAMAADPRFAPYIDAYALLKANAGMMDFPAQDLIKPREQAEEEMAKQGPDPNLVLAQAKAESEQARAVLLQAQTQAQSQQTQIEQTLATLKAQAMQAAQATAAQDHAMNVANRQVEHEETMRALDIREEEARARVETANIREDTERVKLAQASADAAQNRAANATAKAAEIHSRLMVKGMDTEQAAREMALKQQTGSGI